MAKIAPTAVLLAAVVLNCLLDAGSLLVFGVLVVIGLSAAFALSNVAGG